MGYKYCDGTSFDRERDALDLAFGRKKPKTKYEKKLLQDINEVKKKGGQLELPHD